jgi:putative nucleotidyltransferase with HDIG domain
VFLSPEIKQLLARQPIDIPVFHPVALKLTMMIPDPYSDFDDIVKVISEDQALSAQVLKMANSSAYMGMVKAETIKDSAVRLGVSQISALAMAASQSSLHASSNADVNVIMQELWQHSLACAVGAWWTAQNTGHEIIVDHAYLAGLLHDIGSLYLLKSIERLVQQKTPGVSLDKSFVKEVFREMHVEQGIRIMEHWNIPAIYSSVVANHHQQSADQVDTLLIIVRLVNAVSRNIHLSLDKENAVPLMEIPEIEMLGMDESQCLKLETVMVSSRA